MRFDGTGCVSWRTCPPGSYWSSAFGECRARVRNCPYGYSFRPGYGCMPTCPAGWYYSGGSCRKPAQACPDSMFYSYGLRRCVRKCGLGQYWDYKIRACRGRSW